MRRVLRWEATNTNVLSGEEKPGGRQVWVVKLEGQTVARVERGDHWTYRAAYAKKRGVTVLHWAPLVPAFRSFREAERWVERNLPKAILKAVGEPASRRQEAAARLEDMALAVA